MNAERRKKIADATTILESVRDDEQSALDNMPEDLQQSDAGDKAQTAIVSLETAIFELESIE